MWTDGRYFLQASQQMDNNWTLMKMGNFQLDVFVDDSKQLPLYNVIKALNKSTES